MVTQLMNGRHTVALYSTKNTAVRKVAFCARIYYHTEFDDPEVVLVTLPPQNTSVGRAVTTGVGN